MRSIPAAQPAISRPKSPSRTAARVTCAPSSPSVTSRLHCPRPNRCHSKKRAEGPDRNVSGGCAGWNVSRAAVHFLLPVAGLVPATHVFAKHSTEQKEGVDGRDKPGQGGSEIQRKSARPAAF